MTFKQRRPIYSLYPESRAVGEVMYRYKYGESLALKGMEMDETRGEYRQEEGHVHTYKFERREDRRMATTKAANVWLVRWVGSRTI